MIVTVLGTAQDGGYPQAGCREACCAPAWKNKSLIRFPSCIALINPDSNKYWLFDVTPDVKQQIDMLDSYNCSLAGVFITHAHIGHYMGMINFGLEVMNLKNLPVYIMPRMKHFLETNSIIKQLLINKNIELIQLNDDKPYDLGGVEIIPFDVPHRNELSETVGFRIIGSKKRAVYLPDIDSWDDWTDKLIDLINSNDILFIDGTFFSKTEIRQRDISKIPHPEIIGTMEMLSHLSFNLKQKIHFIHFNHTNEVLLEKSEAAKSVIDKGFLLSREMQSFKIS
tara:strand:- start:261 stop:1106 length:846 start_codon:yes stop_codon:yes gene_type:complete